MRIALFSNFMNHHQLPLCQALDRLTEGQFTFVATRPVSESRKNLGFRDMDHEYPFVLTTYDNPQGKKLAMQLAEECDVMIIGSAPEVCLQRRMTTGKLTFRYAERLYKKGYWHALSPFGQRNMRRLHTVYRKQPLYMLCASQYTAGDYALSGAYVDKAFRWAYFPEVKPLDIDALMEKRASHNKVKLLWVGRLLDWKHPEAAVKTAEYLHKKGYDFEMNIVGTGPMQESLQRRIDAAALQDKVSLTGSMPPEQVRDYMEQSDIFLFTSDRGEGWGAVLNEAMNAGCAVVASHAIGSVGFLMQHNESGMIYHSGRQTALNKAVRTLIDDGALRRRLGTAAYRTMMDTWNADTAAERLLALCEALQKGEDTPFAEGPCSKAPRVYR